MKKGILIFLLLIVCMESYAQFGDSSFGLQYPILGNPATTGMSPETEVFVGYRDQWSGFEGAPRRMHAGIQGRLNQKSGVGAIVHSRNWGIFDDVGANLYYSHKLNLGNNQRLRLGLSTHLLQRSINDNRLDVNNLEADMVLTQNYSDDMNLQFNFGMLYQWKDLTVGLAFPSIYEGGSQSMLSNKNILVMYDFHVLSEKIILRPGLQFNRNNLMKNQQVLTLQALWKKTIWVQAGYNSIGGPIISTGLQYEKIGVNYGYDMNQGELGGLAVGSHEVMLTYKFSKKKESDDSDKVPF